MTVFQKRPTFTAARGSGTNEVIEHVIVIWVHSKSILRFSESLPS